MSMSDAVEEVADVDFEHPATAHLHCRVPQHLRARGHEGHPQTLLRGHAPLHEEAAQADLACAGPETVARLARPHHEAFAEGGGDDGGPIQRCRRPLADAGHEHGAAGKRHAPRHGDGQGEGSGSGRTPPDSHLAEVEDGLANEQLLARQVPFDQKALEERVDAVRIATLQYKAGRRDLLWVAQLQTEQLAANAQVIKLKGTQRANRVRLQLALGGSFDALPATAQLSQ